MSAPMDLIEMGLIEIDLPGPLPEAFLALSAAAIPDNPADLVARSAPSHWWFESGGRARAWVVPGRGRIAAFDHPDARTDGRNVGFFGWWESTGDATADAALFAAAERSLTTKFLMPPGVRDGATSPDAGRRGDFRVAAGLAAGLGAVFAAIQVSWVLSSNSCISSQRDSAVSTFCVNRFCRSARSSSRRLSASA